MSRSKRSRRNKRQIRNNNLKLKNFLKIMSIIFVVIFVLVIIFVFIWKVLKFENKKAEFIEKDRLKVHEIFEGEDYSNIKTEQKNIEDININIIALGSINCESKLYKELYDNRSDTYMFLRCMNNVQEYIGISDYTFMNLGANLSNIIYKDNENDCIPDDLAIALKDAGIDLVNLASYNINNLGQEGLENTIEILDNAKLEHIGVYDNNDERDIIKIVDVRGIKIAFLGYTDKLKKGITKNGTYYINIINEEKIKNDIQTAKEQGAEIVIVSLDWQNQESDNVYAKQEKLLKRIIDNGADIIIGNINNKTNKIEVKQNEEGKTYCIAYSLGSFLSVEEPLEISLNIDITKSKKDGSVKISKVNYNPIYMIDKGENSENRYSLIDLEQEMERYNVGIESKITSEKYLEIEERLTKLENKIKKE